MPDDMKICAICKVCKPEYEFAVGETDLWPYCMYCQVNCSEKELAACRDMVTKMVSKPPSPPPKRTNERRFGNQEGLHKLPASDFKSRDADGYEDMREHRRYYESLRRFGRNCQACGKRKAPREFPYRPSQEPRAPICYECGGD